MAAWEDERRPRGGGDPRGVGVRKRRIKFIAMCRANMTRMTVKQAEIN
jgi:hypothetical protein